MPLENFDQANMKSVFGKTMSNNYAECAQEINMSVYTESVWENDFGMLFQKLGYVMLCFYNKYNNENFE